VRHLPRSGFDNHEGFDLATSIAAKRYVTKVTVQAIDGRIEADVEAL